MSLRGPLLIVLSASILPSGKASGETVHSEVIGRVAGRLASPLVAEREEGEKELAVRGGDIFETLFEMLEDRELGQQQYASDMLAILVSPWAQGKAFHLNRRSLSFVPRRPVERAQLHFRAPMIRRRALAALEAMVVDEGASIGAVWGICLLLAEVGDPGTADSLARMLSGEKRSLVQACLMGGLESYHGLPTFYREPDWICDVPPRQVTAPIFEAARQDLLIWHRRHAGMVARDRIDAVLDLWEERLPLSVAGLERLIRLGDAAVPALRRKMARARTQEEAVAFGIALAAITGKGDELLLQGLLLGSAAEKALACRVILASGSGAWRRELEALLRDEDANVREKAANVLAACHGKAALPALRRIPPEMRITELIEALEWLPPDLMDGGK